MRSSNPCACGCGQFTTRLENKYLQGHNPDRPYNPKPKKPCACGCGTMIRGSGKGKYASGHNPNTNFYHARNERRACLCGCLTLTKSDSGYVPGHEPTKLCGCGCGEPVVWVKGNYLRGHGPKLKRPKKAIVWNLCACGCGEKCRRKYVHGHRVRVENPSTMPHVKEMRRIQMTKLHAAGLMPEAWAKGLKAGDDARLDRFIAGAKAIQATAEWKAAMSESMRANRVTLRGKDHWNWKGGSSDIVCMLRGYSGMYKHWKLPILIRDEFRCVSCGADGRHRLQVHHDKETMAQIIARFVPKNRKALTFEQKIKIRNQIVKYHKDNNVSGITYCKKCHDKEHERLKNSQ